MIKSLISTPAPPNFVGEGDYEYEMPSGCPSVIQLATAISIEQIGFQLIPELYTRLTLAISQIAIG